MSNAIVLVVIVALSVAVLLNLFLTLALVRRMGGGRSNATVGPLKKGQPAPDFKAETLEGVEVGRTQFLGRRTLFLFGSPTCQPCMEALPTWEQLGKLAPATESEVVVVMNGEREAVEKALKGRLTSCRVILAPSEQNTMLRDWNIMGTPTFVEIERGVVKSSGVVMPTFGLWQEVVRSFDTRDVSAGLVPV